MGTALRATQSHAPRWGGRPTSCAQLCTQPGSAHGTPLWLCGSHPYLHTPLNPGPSPGLAGTRGNPRYRMEQSPDPDWYLDRWQVTRCPRHQQQNYPDGASRGPLAYPAGPS